MSDGRPAQRDPMAGFFVSVLVALLVSDVLATQIVALLSTGFERTLGLVPPPVWADNLASGLFIGITVADPVGAALARARPVVVAARFLIGLSAGVLLQSAVVTPLAGAEIGRFVLLMGVMVLLPLVYATVRTSRWLDEQGIRIDDIFATISLRVLDLPDRVLSVSLTLLSVCVLAWVDADLSTSAGILAAIVAFTALRVGVAPAVESDPWAIFEMTEDRRPSLIQAAGRAYRDTASELAPGAVLYGTVGWMALQVLVPLLPWSYLSLDGTLPMLQTLLIVTGAVAATVFAGLAISLLASLALLEVFARLRRWSGAMRQGRRRQVMMLMFCRPAR